MEITKEIKEKMLGLLPFSGKETDTFTPDRFETRKGVPKELKPIITLRPLSEPEKKHGLKLMRNMSTTPDDDLRDAARKNTIGWENMFDIATGEEIVFKAEEDGSADKATFKKLPRTMAGDILFRLVKIAGLIDLEVTGLKF